MSDATRYDAGDPEATMAVDLITDYQMRALSDSAHAAVEQRLQHDPEFAAAVRPVLWGEHVLREEGERMRAAVAERSARTAARVVAMTAAELGREASTPRPRPGRRPLYQRWSGLSRLTRVYAAAGAVSMTAWSYTVYGDIVRSHIPPAEVTFHNAPLSVVMAEVSRRYNVDMTACDAGFNRDRVTLTLRNVPLDTVIREIRRQTLRWAHWSGTRTLRLQPEPDLPRGWIYNLTLFVRSYTGWGCHR